MFTINGLVNIVKKCYLQIHTLKNIKHVDFPSFFFIGDNEMPYCVDAD